MSKISWIGEESELDDVFIQLGYSKSQIKKSNLKKKQRLKVIRNKSTVDLPENLFNRFIINPTFAAQTERPCILSQNDDFLVLSKPPFVHTHPLSYGESDNVLSFLREESFFDFLRPFHGLSYDRGLLFRLDYETSGLLILSNSEAFIKRYRSGEVSGVRKFYWAVVEGHCNRSERLKHFLTTSGKMVHEDTSGQEANIFTEYIAYDEESNSTLLKVELQEGLRHQIRVQLSLIGHPILGDSLYGAKPVSKCFGLHCSNYQIGAHNFEDTSFSLLKNFNL